MLFGVTATDPVAFGGRDCRDDGRGAGRQLSAGAASDEGAAGDRDARGVDSAAAPPRWDSLGLVGLAGPTGSWGSLGLRARGTRRTRRLRRLVGFGGAAAVVMASWLQLTRRLPMSLAYHKLVVWQRADDLFIDIHRLTLQHFPREEKYELGSQLTNVRLFGAREHR